MTHGAALERVGDSEIGRAPRSLRHVGLVALGTAVAFAGYWLVARGSRSVDFHLFRAAGQAVLDGRSPYPHLPLTASIRHDHPFVYPLPAAWLYVPFALIDYWLSAWLYAGLSIGALFLALWWLEVRSITVFALVLSSSVVISGLTLGTIDAFLLLGVAALVRFRDRPWVAGLTFAVLVALKPLMLPLVVYLVVTGRRRALAAAAAGGATLIAAALAADFSTVGYARLLHQLTLREALHSDSLVHRLVVWTGASLNAATVAVALAGGVLLASTLILGLRWRLDHRAVLAVSVGGALLVSPIVWPHYVLLCWAPLLLLRRTTLIAAAGWAATWLLFSARLPLQWVPHPLSGETARAVGVLVPLVVVAVVLAATAARAARGTTLRRPLA